MSYWTQWELYGKHADGRLLAEAQIEPLLEALINLSDEWHTSAPEGETLCAFTTDYSSGYESTANAVADFSKTMPAAVFLLKCHNTDEDWYQRIYFQNGKREAIDGYIAYDEPRAIRYDAPSPSELLIVLQGGSVQGVFANNAVSAGVTIVDRDLSKLEGASPEEACDTAAWIEGQLERCRKMQALYGSIDRL
jgi:hypothetical protein